MPDSLGDSVVLMCIAFFSGAVMLGAALIKSADRGAKNAMPTFLVGVLAMAAGFVMMSKSQHQTSDLFDYGTKAVSDLVSAAPGSADV